MLRTWIAFLAALLVALVAVSAAPAPTASTTLKVMSFNIFYGGDEHALEASHLVGGEADAVVFAHRG